MQHRRDTFDARSKQHGAFPLKEGEKETFADGMADKGFALSVAQAVVDRLVEIWDPKTAVAPEEDFNDAASAITGDINKYTYAPTHAHACTRSRVFACV